MTPGPSNRPAVPSRPWSSLRSRCSDSSRWPPRPRVLAISQCRSILPATCATDQETAMATRMRAPGALLELQRAVEGARRSNWPGSSTAGYGTFPPTNVFRQGHDFVLVAELPGVDKESLDVQVKGRQVHVRGMKKVEFADAARVHRRSRGARAKRTRRRGRTGRQPRLPRSVRRRAWAD